MANRTGDHLGNYRLVRLLGQGGFAEVYLGEHMHLGTQAAIKLLHTQLAGEDTDAFRLEARIIARLEHPHIVRVLDFGVEGTTPFLVMSFAAGGTLRQLYPKGTRLSLPTVVSYVRQVAAALQYAHDQKLIHRDVKPENILLGRHQEVLLSDFGIALVAQTSRHQLTLPATGTVAYMAPEQIQGKPRPQSDQYSLGIIVYEWLSGTLPFTGSAFELFGQHLHVPPTPLREKVPSIPAAVEQVVMLALAKDPKQRFGSVQAFAKAFEQASQVEEERVKAQLKEQARKAEEAEQARKAEEKLAREAEEKRIRQVEEERVKAQLKEQARKAEEAEQARKAEEKRIRQVEEERVKTQLKEQARSQPPYRCTAEGLSQSTGSLFDEDWDNPKISSLGFPPPKMGTLAQQYENGSYGSNYPTQQPGTWDAPAQDPWGHSQVKGNSNIIGVFFLVAIVIIGIAATLILANVKPSLSNVLWWLLVGLVAGFLASRVMRGGGYGLIGDIVVGLIGAFIGGWLARLLGLGSFGLIGTIVVAFIGACILLAILHAVSRPRDAQ